MPLLPRSPPGLIPAFVHLQLEFLAICLLHTSLVLVYVFLYRVPARVSDRELPGGQSLSSVIFWVHLWTGDKMLWPQGVRGFDE